MVRFLTDADGSQSDKLIFLRSINGMLRSEHAILTFDSGIAHPDRLSRSRHGHYLAYARQMLAAYESGTGKMRRDLHRSIEAIFANEPDCDRRRIAGFC